ncbi:MAG: pseudouridine synthase [Marivibrio sp.]|uniref:pseudouridine synthase n=1 Tax=Marivibrio sp. TaxID=2039719 RepID=UPI0032EB9F69
MTASDPPSPDASAAASAGERQRIAKRIARAGLCSRRDAERWIEAGRVRLNGALLKSPAVDVGPEDEIVVDGKPLPAAEPARLWRYHKPRGLVTSARDEQGRATVFDNLPQRLPRVVSVGRLDINSEGLLLLTNDGEVARKLELPSTGWSRRYRVRVHGAVDPEKLKTLADGVTVEGVSYGPIRAEVEKQQTTNAWVLVSLQEGKNREVRRVMEHLGYQVNRLIRIAYGPFQLGRLNAGEVEEVSPRVLREQLGEAKRIVPGEGGAAKAKPKPVKPGHRKGPGFKTGRKKPAAKGGSKRAPAAPPADAPAGAAKRTGPKGAARRAPKPKS